MNAVNHITNEQAMNAALAFAGIADEEYVCLSSCCRDGYYHIAVWTPYLKYEFYVDALDGEVAGIDTVPVPCREALMFSATDGEDSPAAA